MRPRVPAVSLAAFFALACAPSARAFHAQPFPVTAPVYSVAYATNGNVYFTTNAATLGYRTFAGVTGTVNVLTGTGQTSSVVAAPNDTIWYSYSNAAKIGRYDPRAFFSPFTEYPIASASFAMTVGPDGGIWFVESGANKIGHLTLGGALTEYPVTTANANLSAITAGGDGALWFTEYAAKKIGRITVAGNVTEFGPTNTAPSGIALGADGNVWYMTFDKIGRITPFGTITEYPQSVAGYQAVRGGDGWVWWADAGNGRLGRIATDATIRNVAIDVAGGSLQGIAAGADGAIWVGLGGADELLRISFPEPGDTNGDGAVDVLDVFYLANFLFAGGPPP